MTAPADQLEITAPGDKMAALAAQLKPLGNPTRLKLLDLLVEPRYVEEVASKLLMSRQGARKHLDELVQIGILSKHIGQRETGAVVEYVLDRAILFQIQAAFGEVGARRQPSADPAAMRTLPDGHAAPAIRNRSGRACLTVVKGLDEGALTHLSNDAAKPLLIGRNPEAALRLDYDPFVSGRHAQVTYTEAGFQVVDLYSKNGTLLNWQPLRAGIAEPLRRGDVLGVGKTLFVAQIQE